MKVTPYGGPVRMAAPVRPEPSELSNMTQMFGSAACPKWKAPAQGSPKAKAKTPGLPRQME